MKLRVGILVLQQPVRDYALIALLVIAFATDFFATRQLPLAVIAFVAVLPTIWGGISAIFKRRITIDAFNAFAVIVSFATQEFRSAGFIALMLVAARILEWRTSSKTKSAMSALLRLKPQTAVRERNGRVETIPATRVQRDDILLIGEGQRIPVDGVVIHGTCYVNESSVTGESVPVFKVVSDPVLSATLVETGAAKIRATRVGRDSTIERMAALMAQAERSKSRSEKLADRFAGIFLPIVGVLGLLTYLVTKNIAMTAALFLVACADDMAVAIPLAMTAALGRAAKRGVVVKGGEWLETIRKIDTLVLDKTGTLTFGSLAVKHVMLAPETDEKTFWRSIAIAEKYSEHPIGKTAFRAALPHTSGDVPDPDDVRTYRGAGVRVTYRGDHVVVGSDDLIERLGLSAPSPRASLNAGETIFFVYRNQTYLGSVTVADIPRDEAAASIAELRRLGVKDIIMLTGDNPQTAKQVAKTLGITSFRASMRPEDKLREINRLVESGRVVGMIGDGINDAPALARADVGVAMGGAGTAVTVEAADIVILTDDLMRLPEMIELGRRTHAVVSTDIAIWVATNLVGFALVFTGIAGPAIAAGYNFATDFLPLLNSTRLFSARYIKSPSRVRTMGRR